MRLLQSAEAADTALRAYGKECFAAGMPRYWLVYAITAGQHIRPQFRNFLAGAWQVDRKWQIEEPGQCSFISSFGACYRQLISVLGLEKFRSYGSSGIFRDVTS